MLDRPWMRLVLGAVVALALGAFAARVAVSVSAGGNGGVGSAGGYASGAATGGSAGGGSGSGSGDRSTSGTGGASAGGGDSSSGGSGPASGGGSGGGTGADGASAGATATLSGGAEQVTVHVTGAVRHSGVYTLPDGSRVQDAVRRAGGATSRADRERLNLAAPIRDGQQVLVPEVVAAAGSAGAGGGVVGGGAGAAAGGGAGGTGAPIDLNTATLEELQTLDGVGPSTAQKIVEFREQHGGLAGVDDLDEVPGIGPKKLEALRAQLEG